MKHLILTCIAIVFISLSAQAQEISKNAIGLRLGDSDGFGAEVSYQRSFKENNRFEIDFGWRSGNTYDGVKLTGLYQWVWLLDGSFNWYVGAGGGISSFRINNTAFVNNKDTFAFAAGNIGIEYHFDIPLLLSLDLRPEIGFGDDRYDNNDLDFDVGVGVRYQF